MKCLKYFILLVMFLLHTNVKASQYLVVQMKSGAKVFFDCNNAPKITFEQNIISISTDLFQIDNVQKYYFSQDLNDGISVPTIEKGNCGPFVIENGKIGVHVNDISAPLRFTTASGIAVNAEIIVSDKHLLLIDMSGLKPDVYILSIGQESIKILKR